MDNQGNREREENNRDCTDTGSNEGQGMAAVQGVSK